MLADHFVQVIATDASEAQISNATAKDGVRYAITSAEESGIDARVIDLVTVAQALHWFDIDAFAKEANRVLKDAGIIAVWTYNLLDITPKVNACVQTLYADIVGDYWPEERLMVENAYCDISLPLVEIEAPSFEMSANWSLSELVGYLCTWSATKHYQAAKGVNPVEIIYPELATAWGEAQTRDVSWPLSMRIWKK